MIKLSLIICTYQRPAAVMALVNSIGKQAVYPDQILIIDGSENDDTGLRFRESVIKNLTYYKVPAAHRGLTKQRNYGIVKVEVDTDIVAFLDDDVLLDGNYFKELISSYKKYPEALAIGGYITNEVHWEKTAVYQHDSNYFYYDGNKRKESSRYKLRKKLGLVQLLPPGKYPAFGHGRSISFLPPSGKIYETDLVMGGVSSFPKKVVDQYKFSEYFQGYGLYEDAHYSLKLSNIGKLYINTAAQLEHHHDPAGRPDAYKYGKMVVRNGWYVWRTKFNNPNFKDRFKWWMITLLLASIRASNTVTTSDRKNAAQETLGRFAGMISLINTPK